MNKKLMLGNEAIARGLYEAGVNFVSSYPGTPSTEITEYAAEYDELYAEWAPNEKVAAEGAFGASIVGARAFTAMKHVGVNVMADLLFTASYIGVNGGFVMAVADDMGMHSSQDEQDSRHYAKASKVPMLEPSNSQECIDYIKKAYEISEKYDTPVFVRTSTRIAHSQSLVTTTDRENVQIKEYKKDFRKNVMLPANGRVRHVFVEERTEKLINEIANVEGINQIIRGDDEIGIITSGTGFNYAYEALGDKASYLKLGMVYPMPTKLIEDFAKSVKKLYIIEELDDIFETQVRKMGIPVTGGKDLFSLCGEYTAEQIREKILGIKIELIETTDVVSPPRPPVLCPGCPHRGIFHVFSKMGLVVSGDIGCYTLGSLAPLSAMDTTIDMGASVSALHGMNIVRGSEFAKKSVAVIGDSTFLHSGVTGLMNIVYNGSASTVVILDNSITGMTGHQQNPSTGLTLKGKPAYQINFVELCSALGVKRIQIVDPFDLEACEKVLAEELNADEPSVVIVQRPCALLPIVEKKPSVCISDCKKCKVCMKIGCPAISFTKENGAVVDSPLCTGCRLCKNMCKFDCIK